MTRREPVLFDLDGTISDNSIGIVNGAIIGLQTVGITHVGEAEIRTHIGPPLREMFAAFGLGPADVERAVVGYRHHYHDVGLFENEVYAGIEDTLRALAEAGRILAVATSKPEEFAIRILEHFGLAEHFAVIGGASMDSSRHQKSDVVRHTLAGLGSAAGDAVMIGDRRHDIEGAAAVGVKHTVGVLWGFGDHAELAKAGASVIVDDPAELIAAVDH